MFDDESTGGETQATSDSGSVEQVTPEVSTPTESHNPAWDNFLGELPDAYHGVAKKHLGEFDRGVNQRFETLNQRYAPYKEIIEQQIPPQDLVAAYQLSNQFDADPMAVYERMGQFLQQQGYTPQQAQEAVEAAAEANGDDNFEEYRDPRVDELERKQEELLYSIRQQAEAQETEQIFQETATSIDQFQQQHRLPNWELAEVLDRAARMPQPDLDAAFNSWNKVKANFGAASPGRDAPGVLSASGGNPATPARNFADLSKEEQRADTLRALEALRD